jgi:hypothetical protein
MVEIPEHLLARSRARRFGLGRTNADQAEARSALPYVLGKEWRGLRAVNSLSLIPPSDDTYTVRINDDNTFSVFKETSGGYS